MLAETIMRQPLNVLTKEQRNRYFSEGFLVLDDYVPSDWLSRLSAAMAELIDRSRSATSSDSVFVLEEGHSPSDPRLHRVSNPQDHNSVFWDFFCSPVVTDIVADVVGPDVKFHHAKLNVKSQRGTRGFNLHQDIPGWPHTDFSPVTVGVYLDGCTPDQGPLTFAPGSHLGPLYSLYNDKREFSVQIGKQDLEKVDTSKMVTATGGPGTMVLLNCRTVHGSAINTSSRPRPLLLPVFTSADSFPYTPSPIPSLHQGDIVRGSAASYANFDPRPCELPPDFRAGYTSQFEIRTPVRM